MRISQIVISSASGRGDLKYSKSVTVFTEYGIAMLSSVLNSPEAIQVNIQIMRTFGKLREMIASHAELARRLDELEQKYDARFRVVFDAIRKMMAPEEKGRRGIGFRVEEGGRGVLLKRSRVSGPRSRGKKPKTRDLGLGTR